MKNNADYTTMRDYIRNADLTPSEAYYVVVMEGLNHPSKIRRNREVDFVYFAMNFAKEMSKEKKLSELSIPFLNQFYDLTLDYLYNLVNICYFPDDIKNGNYAKCIELFYEFFARENIDYGNHKFEAIKNYFIDDKDNSMIMYKALMAVDLNLLVTDAGEMALLLEKVDIDDLRNYFTDNDISLDKLTHQQFLKQLSYVYEKYLDRKYLKRKTK